MKKSPHGLHIDRRKSMQKNLKENGLQEERTENSGFVKVRRSKIKKLERKLAQTTDTAERNEIQAQIDERLERIAKFLNK